MNKFTLIGIFSIFLIWTVVTQFNIIDSFFLPHPEEVILKLLTLLQNGELNTDITLTSIRVIFSFCLAGLLGIPIGLFIGSNEKIYNSTEIIIDFIRSTPAPAIFPLFLLIFGVDDKSKIALAVFCISAIIMFNTAQGVRNSKKPRIEAVKLMGASKMQIFKEITFWEALPQTIVGLRTSISLSLTLIILTEMFIGTQYGLGRRIIDYQYTYSITSLYATILLTGILGYLLNQIFASLEKKVIHWNRK
jgi:NitT/TauT family transport system permease protein